MQPLAAFANGKGPETNARQTRICELVKPPRVSVVMSCFNAERWLAQASASVLAQTFEDFEFIMVDDGSTDGTADAIERLSSLDRRVQPIRKPNTGLTDSLNVGIRGARGEWIARLDCDDLCEPTRLEKQLEVVRGDSTLILLGTGCVEIDEHGKAITRHAYPAGHSSLVRHLLRVQRFFPHSSAFFARKAAISVGGYRTRLQRAQDRDLWLRLSSHGRIACLREPLVQIRKHPGQISHDENGRRQMTDCRAGIVSYLMRRWGEPDPVEASDAEWRVFLSWLERRLEEEAVFESQNFYVGVRSELFQERSMIARELRLAIRVLRSPYARLILRERLVGSGIPRRAAREWQAGLRGRT